MFPNLVFYPIIILILLCGLSNIPALGHQRNKRILGLFNIIRFDNVECNDREGVCFSTGDCINMGGSTNGNCASGFGVCCVFSTNTCGSTVTQNVSFIRNPGFPSALNSPQTCSFTIQRLNTNICQLRLDFLRRAVGTGDEITVTSASGFNPPGIGGLCGDNMDGQHMYVEFGSGNSITWSIVVGSDTSVNRLWNIKTSQIPCNSNFKAPNGCVQYFTGPSGTISSYNRAGQRLPVGSTYQNSTSQVAACTAAGITIPGAVGTTTNTFCQTKFNAINAQTVNGVIRSEEIPFRLGVAVQDAGNANLEGFELTYNQIPC
ncbi:unnamed protein product [Lepeophtheirus salmonis]|uniref:(salmon louse) hypothetical protein n=1 Tax=Lepeophtheirus salmonis TaxID=72036 RepID=A0A7R8CML2_LEPSM|nr:unnamed protein product [Lepeophtheirus salmonis]CAF2833149.1 unnamed protein product [Lepeophtheirus salmonis]